MKQYPIARTDLSVSRIAYGCMHLSRAWDQTALTEQERGTTEQMIEAALEQGINLFDHADIYARGKSEILFGEVLGRQPSLRQRMVLQSKCGIRFANDPDAGVPGRYDFSHDHIVGSVETSLRRLQTDYLDILLLHRPDPLGEPEQVARAFDDLQRAGKVRYFGVSNHSASQLALLQQHVTQPLVINQLELSLPHHHLINEAIIANTTGAPYAAAAGTLDYCRQQRILVQAWAPLAGGRLTGAVPVMPETHALIAGLQRVAKQYEVSAEAILLAWLLRHPAGIQPIVGSTRRQRLQAACQADGFELSREDWYRLFTLARGAPVP
ncbi:aldo/keto reductase [Pseudoxanthomonas dokdonensis]|uniref:Aldo/keto reductase n=2 Tax=Pseudoxanthomonas dokdonensis TaxID=344882 RepID=A0A0R0CTA5_9GAMM|nr:aldo/keto reductase [Pseudoxanthomonas dokdonensis]